MLNDKKIGKFRIDARFVRREPERVFEAFKIMKFVPVRAEHLFCSEEIEYMGMADRFEEIAQGEQVPEYKIIIAQSDAGNVELVEFEKFT